MATMNKLNILIITLLITTLSSCATKSVAPFYTEERVIKPEPSLNGVWAEVIKDEEKGWIELGAQWSINERDIEVQLQEGAPLLLYLTPFEAGDSVFVDMILYDDELSWNYHLWTEQTYYVHTVWKLKRVEDKLALIPLSDEWLIKEIKDERISMPYVGNSDTPLFTASSEQWIWFLQKYAAHSGAFNEEDFQTIWLKRVGDLPPPESKENEGKHKHHHGEEMQHENLQDKPEDQL